MVRDIDIARTDVERNTGLLVRASSSYRQPISWCHTTAAITVVEISAMRLRVDGSVTETTRATERASIECTRADIDGVIRQIGTQIGEPHLAAMCATIVTRMLGAAA